MVLFLAGTHQLYSSTVFVSLVLAAGVHHIFNPEFEYIPVPQVDPDSPDQIELVGTRTTHVIGTDGNDSDDYLPPDKEENKTRPEDEL